MRLNEIKKIIPEIPDFPAKQFHTIYKADRGEILHLGNGVLLDQPEVEIDGHTVVLWGRLYVKMSGSNSYMRFYCYFDPTGDYVDHERRARKWIMHSKDDIHFIDGKDFDKIVEELEGK